MTEFWLVRHGQTDWNIERRYQGKIDIPLNETGLAQARASAEILAGIPFAGLYCSSLQRALKTAQIIAAANNLTLQVDERLSEASFGEWEGMLYSDVKERYPEAHAARRDDPVYVAPPGGENVAHLAERMRRAADDIAARHPGENILLVSHGLALATLLCQARQIPLKDVFSQIMENAQPERIIWSI